MQCAVEQHKFTVERVAAADTEGAVGGDLRCRKGTVEQARDQRVDKGELLDRLAGRRAEGLHRRVNGSSYAASMAMGIAGQSFQRRSSE